MLSLGTDKMFAGCVLVYFFLCKKTIVVMSGGFCWLALLIFKGGCGWRGKGVALVSLRFVISCRLDLPSKSLLTNVALVMSQKLQRHQS